MSSINNVESLKQAQQVMSRRALRDLGDEHARCYGVTEYMKNGYTIEL